MENHSIPPPIIRSGIVQNPIIPPCPPSNFEYLPKHDQRMVKDAYDVISRNELWRTFREALLARGVDARTGFTYSSDPVYNKIMTAIGSTYIGGAHSGCSMGYVMRQMEFIALHGEEEYRIKAQQNNQ